MPLLGLRDEGTCASLCGASPRVHRPRVAIQHHIPTRILPLRSLRASLLQPRLAKIDVQTQPLPSVSDLPGLIQARGDGSSFQMMKEHSGDKRVPSMESFVDLVDVSHFSSTSCIAAMAKRAQQESGEERVTAKSRPMMNLTAKTPSFVSSSASSSPGKTCYECQDPGKSVAGDDRSGKPERPSPPGYSKEDYGRSWSSQEWKSGAAAHDRSGKLLGDMMQQVVLIMETLFSTENAQSVRYGEMILDGSGQPDSVNCQEEADSENFVMGSDAVEFVNKVKEQVRKRQKRMSIR